MKKLLLLTSIFLVAGCGENKKPETRFGMGTNQIFVETVRGHDYVIYDGYYKGGIVHAESCPCKDSQKLKHYDKDEADR